MKFLSKGKRLFNALIILVAFANIPALANNYSIEDLKSISIKANDLEFQIARDKDQLDLSVKERTSITTTLSQKKRTLSELNNNYKTNAGSIDKEFQIKIDALERERAKELEPKSKEADQLNKWIQQGSNQYMDQLSKVYGDIKDINTNYNSQINEIEGSKQNNIDDLYVTYDSQSSRLKFEINSLEDRAAELDKNITSLTSEIGLQTLKLNPAKDQKMNVYKILAAQRADKDYSTYKYTIESPNVLSPFIHKKVCGDDISKTKCQNLLTDEARKMAIASGAELIVTTISEMASDSSTVNGNAISSSSFSEKSNIKNKGSIVDWEANYDTDYSTGTLVLFINVTRASVKSIADESKRRSLLNEQLEILKQYLNLRTSSIAPKPVAIAQSKPKEYIPPVPRKPIPKTVNKPLENQVPRNQFGNEQSLEVTANEEREKLDALRKKQAEKDDGWGFGTYALIGGGAIGAGLALAGGEEEPETEECTQGIDCPGDGGSDPEYDGTYIIELSGTVNQSFEGVCNNNAAIVISDVDVTTTSSTISISFGLSNMSGTLSDNSFSINGNSSSVTSSPGFVSTDAIEWSSFSGSFNSETSFTSNSFELITSENGIEECSYQITLSGNR